MKENTYYCTVCRHYEEYRDTPDMEAKPHACNNCATHKPLQRVICAVPGCVRVGHYHSWTKTN